MARAIVDGVQVRYETLGSGPPLVLTPGGRFDLMTPGLSGLARALAEQFMVLLWDRPNTGESDVVFNGTSESEMWADTLAGLIRGLGMGPAVLAGGSAGARTSLLAALRHPEVTSAVAAWWISGGPFGTFSLGAAYVLPSLEAAHRGGMPAVAALPHWAERIRVNPRNAHFILDANPAEFISVMERWLQAYVPSRAGPVAGIADADIARITTPVVVVRGDSRDYNHPESVSRHVQALAPRSALVEPPWDDGEWLRLSATMAGDAAGDPFRHWPQLAPVLLDGLGALDVTSGA
jgi:pimeloyl-ACP methyl ester carboxylesterase